MKTGIPVNFYTLTESAWQKGETSIEYRIASLAFDNSKTYGVIVNPIKSKFITFSELDKIIVVSEE